MTAGRRRGKRLGAALALLLLGAALTPVAVSGQAPPREGLALVLGGGGARGAAHIGVLQALEELRVPVDLVVGTSMGAVIGGLYSAGLTPNVIERSALGINWSQVFRGSPPRDDLNFRRKQDDIRFPVQLEFGFREGSFRLPRGLVTGQNLTTLMSGLTLPLGTLASFDSLPIPFRAVAVDIGTGEAVTLEGGDLVDAIRASMAVPGMFVPLEIDGRLLVDGGLRNNLPIDVAQQAGAQAVIAVDVATPPMTRERLGSALAISQQAMRFPIQGMTREQIERLDPRRDVLLRPQIDSVSFADFAGTARAIDAGRAAVLDARAQLERYAVSEPEYRAWREARLAPAYQPIVLDFVRLDNRSTLDEATLRRTLGVQARRPLDLTTLTEGIDRLFGLGWFESVRFRLEREDDLTGLAVEVVPEPWGPNYVRMGLGFADDLSGNSTFDLLFSYTATQVNRWGGEVRNELQVGGHRRLMSELYQPIGAANRVFVAPRVEWSRDLAEVFTGGERIGELKRTRVGAALDGGSALGTWGEVRVGLSAERLWIRRRLGSLDSLETTPRLTALNARFAVDRLDDRGFPTRGQAYSIGLFRPTRGLGGNVAYSRLEFEGLSAVSWRGGTLLTHGRIGTSLDGGLPEWDAFEVGGFLDVSGLRPRELTGSEMAQLGLTYYRPVATLPTTLAGGRLFLGLSAEAGNAWPDVQSVNLDGIRVGGSLMMGLETLLGPVWFGYGRADRGREAWYLFLGRTF